MRRDETRRDERSREEKGKEQERPSDMSILEYKGFHDTHNTKTRLHHTGMGLVQ